MIEIFNNRIIFFILPFFLGILSSFSLPPYNAFILNFISFTTIFFILIYNIDKSKFTTFLIGWIFGTGYFLSNLYWITKSLSFDENFTKLIPFALFLIPAFLGIFYGFVTLICSYLRLEKNISSILIFALVFSFLEFIRAIIFGGFPWNLIVYSWTEYINVIQILSFIGTYSLNLLSITFFLIPSVIFFNEKLKVKISIFLFAIIICISNIYLGKIVINKFNNLELIKLDTQIKVISPKIEISRFFQSENTEIILNDLIKLLNPEKDKETLFIFPEGILTNVNLENLNKYKNIFEKNFSQKHKIIIGINSLRDSKIYNSMALLDNRTNVLSQYDKNKLVPFGEFLPLESLLSKLGFKKVTIGYQSFSPSNERKITKINNIKYLPLICYEIIYSGNLNQEKGEFNFIINISEDGWFGNSIGPIQHFSHSIFRSIEEGKNLIRSANNGITAHINPIGKIEKIIKSTESGVFEVSSYKETQNTPFGNYGNKIFFYFMLFYITLIFFLKKKGR